MTKKNLYKTQLQIIRFVKNFFLFNSPFLKKNYFAFYEDSNKILEIKSKFLNSQNYKNYLINYFNSFLQSKVIISSNKIEIKKKFKNLIITWGNKKSFSKNGEFFDKYFSYNSNMYKNTYWIVLADRKIKKKLKKNICIIYLNDEFRNKLLKIFIILFNFTLAKLKLKKIIDSDNLISDKINKFIDLNSNFKNLENIIMPYEGQAFQKKIFFHQKKKKLKINTVGFDHSAPHSIATQLYYTKGSPDKLYVSGLGTKNAYVKHYKWPDKKICLTFPNRYKNFRFSSFNNKMFLPYEFDRPEIIENSYSNFLKTNKKFSLKNIEILVHPAKKNVTKHIILKNNLKKITNIGTSSTKFNKKITIVVGFTSAALVAMEFNNTVLHICPNPEIDVYSDRFWKYVHINQIDKYSYLYNLKKKGNYLNFKYSDEFHKIIK